jgi:hypothetical protein
MAEAALFVGWGNAVRGRERKALEVFGEAIAYYTKLAEQGQIDGFEPVFLEPHGGDLAGFFLLRGDSEQLAKLRIDAEFMRLNARAGLIVDGFGVVGASIGAGIDEQMGYYQAAIGDLT